MKVNLHLIVVFLFLKCYVLTPLVMCDPEGQEPKSDNESLSDKDVTSETKENENEPLIYKTIDPEKLKNVDFITFRRLSRMSLVNLNFEDIKLKNFVVRKSIDEPINYKITPVLGKMVKSVSVSKGPMWIVNDDSEFVEAFIYRFSPDIHYFVLKLIEDDGDKYMVTARYQTGYKISTIFDFTCSANTLVDDETVSKEVLDLSSSFDKKYFDHKFANIEDVSYDQYEKEKCLISKIYDGIIKIWEADDESEEDKLPNIVRVYSKGGSKRAILLGLNSDEQEQIYFGFDQVGNKWEQKTKIEFNNILESEMNKIYGKELSKIEDSKNTNDMTKIDISQNKYKVLYTNAIGEFKGLKLEEINTVDSILDGKEVITEQYLEKCNIELIEYKKSTQFLDIQSKGIDNLYFIKTTKDQDKNWQEISQTRYRQILKKYLENDNKDGIKYITIEGKQERELIKDEKELPIFPKMKEESSFVEIKPMVGILGILLFIFVLDYLY